jgi:hypothetical protein
MTQTYRFRCEALSTRRACSELIDELLSKGQGAASSPEEAHLLLCHRQPARRFSMTRISPFRLRLYRLQSS